MSRKKKNKIWEKKQKSAKQEPKETEISTKNLITHNIEQKGKSTKKIYENFEEF